MTFFPAKGAQFQKLEERCREQEVYFGKETKEALV
jgi:hypothetical protein